MKLLMMVACRNANKKPTILRVEVEVTEIERDNGLHYKKAKFLAELTDCLPPFIAFSPEDQASIAEQVEYLPHPIPFTLVDIADEPQRTKGQLKILNGSLTASVEGYTDHTHHEAGELFLLSMHDKELELWAYSDKNEEEATHKINLEGAKTVPPSERDVFNNVIEFASSANDPGTFLTLWSEGDWEAIKRDYPGFVFKGEDK